jgi:hypothetical protein
MPFFSLTDVKIKSPETNFKASTILPSRYDNTVLRYPLDIGSLDKGHYMVIHINEQVKTQFVNNTDETSDPTILQNQRNSGNSQALSQFGTSLGVLKSDVDGIVDAALKGQNLGLLRKIKHKRLMTVLIQSHSDLVNSALRNRSFRWN